MSNIQYVIRHNHFAYNDEWYQTDQATLGAIKAIYTDKDHGIYGGNTRIQLYRKMTNFIKKNL